MSHCLLSAPVRNGIAYFCECGKVLGRISRPFDERDEVHVADICMAHREHARIRLYAQAPIRVGSTNRPPWPITINPERELVVAIPAEATKDQVDATLLNLALCGK